jgi:hypothetical protein
MIIFFLKRSKDVLRYLYLNTRAMIRWLSIYNKVSLICEEYPERDGDNTPDKYLFILKKWRGRDSESRDNDLSYQILASFTEAKAGEFSVIYVDEFMFDNPLCDIDIEIATKINKNKISKVVTFLDSNIEHYFNNFSLSYVVKSKNIELIIILTDSIWFYNRLLCRRYINNSPLFITYDSDSFCGKKYKCKHLFAPYPASDYFPRTGGRDIDVLFIGKTQGRGSRADYIGHLISEGIKVVNIGSGGSGYINYKDYIDYSSRAKIIINFSFSGNEDEYVQLKGRSFETTLMGALLVENKSKIIEKYFEPNVEYIPFNSKESLCECVKYYLSNDSERKVIALNGYKKSKKNFSGKSFWDKVLLD